MEFDRALASGNIVPDLVFGQGGSFVTNGCNAGPPSNGSIVNANSLCLASASNLGDGLGVDQAGDVLISDTGNDRVLVFVSPTNPESANSGAGDTVADVVFGSNNPPGMKSAGPSISATTLSAPHALAMDAEQDLFIADTGANRLLKYLQPLPSSVGLPTPTAAATPTTSPTPVPFVNVHAGPKNLNFGAVAVGVASKPKFITIVNRANSAPGFGVDLGSPTSTNSDFVVTSECEHPLMPTQRCQVKVVFTPSQVKQESGTLTLDANIPGSAFLVNLRGRGKPAKQHADDARDIGQ